MNTQKEVLKKLRELLGNDAVWLIGRDAYGNRQDYQFGFWSTEIAERYHLENTLMQGHTHCYTANLPGFLDMELEANGFESINIWVGTFVHGWIHRVIHLKTLPVQAKQV